MKSITLITLFCMAVGGTANCQEARGLTPEEYIILNTNIDPSITGASILFPGTSHFYVGKPIEGTLLFMTGMAGELAFTLGAYYVIDSQRQTGSNGALADLTIQNKIQPVGLAIVAGGAVAWGISAILDIVDSKNYLLKKKAELDAKGAR